MMAKLATEQQRAEWSGHVRRWKASGQPAAEFAAARGFSAWSLKRWERLERIPAGAKCVPVPIERECRNPECGQLFAPKSRHTRYCSERCCFRARRARHLDRKRAAGEDVPVPVVYWVEARLCEHEVCGKEYRAAHPRQRCCSPECLADLRCAQDKARRLKARTGRHCRNPRCSNVFTPAHGRQVFCSRRCCDASHWLESRQPPVHDAAE